MDIKVNNSWLNESDNEEINEENDNNESLDIIDEESFNKLIDKPINPVNSENKLNIDEFLKNIKQPTINQNKKEKKRLFDFNDAKVNINYYYIVPVVGVLAFMLMK